MVLSPALAERGRGMRATSREERVAGRVGALLSCSVCQSGQLEQPPQPAQLHLSAQALVLDWQ